MKSCLKPNCKNNTNWRNIKNEHEQKTAPYLRHLLTLTLSLYGTALATDDPLEVVNNLSSFIFSLIKAIGMIILAFGIVQVGLSLKSHDASQRATGFLTVAGGIVICFAREILDLITG